MTSKTQKYQIIQEKQNATEILNEIYHALESHGYHAIDHITGYVITGDPTYIPRIDNSRLKITKISRTEILEELISKYFAK